MPPNMVPAPSVGSGVGAGVSSGVGSPAGTFTSTGQGGSGATGINRENLFLNSAAAMYSDGPSKALVGNQDRLPEHLKAKIEAAPGMFDKEPRGTKEEMAQRKIEKRNDRVTKRGDKSIDKMNKRSGKIIEKKKAGKITQALADQRLDENYRKSAKKDLKAKNIHGSREDAKATAKRVKNMKFAPGMYSPFEFTPGGRRTELVKEVKVVKPLLCIEEMVVKKSEFTEKDSGTKKETRYTASPRSLKGKAVKVDVKDNATRTYTKYKRDGSVKKTMTANKKGGVDIDKSKKLRAKNRRSKKGTTRY